MIAFVLIVYVLGGAVAITVLIVEGMRWLLRAKKPIRSAIKEDL